MAQYWAVSSKIYDDYRFKQLSYRQQSICIASMSCSQARLSFGTGIFNISTGSFSHMKKSEVEDELGKKIEVIEIEDVQDELGRTDDELSLKKYNKIIPLKPEEKKEKIGLMVSKFPDVIEYDPQSDMIFTKWMFKYASNTYLSSSKAKIEAIVKEYNMTRLEVEERWWGEFMNINKVVIKDAWQEYCQDYVKEEDLVKGKNKLYLTFQKLLELKEKYKDYKPCPKISVLEAKKITKNEIEFTI